MVTLVTVGTWTSNRTLILYSLMYFTGFLNERLIFYDFFAQLKLSGRIYTLKAVSGLSIKFEKTFI